MGLDWVWDGLPDGVGFRAPHSDNTHTGWEALNLSYLSSKASNRKPKSVCYVEIPQFILISNSYILLVCVVIYFMFSVVELIRPESKFGAGLAILFESKRQCIKVTLQMVQCWILRWLVSFVLQNFWRT